MFKENPQIAYGIGKIMDQLKGMSRGDVISHAMIASLSGVDFKSSQYGTLRQKIRRQALRRLKYTIVAVPGVGYRIATIDDQVNDAMGRGGRASRQLFRGTKEVDSTPDDQCSDHQRRVKGLRIRAFRSARSSALKSNHTEKILSKIQETRPKAMMPTATV